MKLSYVNNLFIQEFYGSKKSFYEACRDDYYKVQFAWSSFIDVLCKNGEITENQYNKACFPSI